ncbi:hypothetical protein MHSWG343_10490 [Candidatus Mycoplasma haematohominis]|uniref:Uncharacterized protein n=1 Tax=Candidatus Mycoplasma haematohominis TaxID=1494318 RepID=A0A478FR55_9MOLU|nr:hypothetical protein MHSWG343_10490 [Candidatus Mycoplasma haemohominis]
MLTESKITIAISTISGNAFLGIAGYEALQWYISGLNSDGEISTIENITIQDIKTLRKKTKTVKATSTSSFDLKKQVSANVMQTVSDSSYLRSNKSTDSQHISQYLNKLINKERTNKNWWDEAYKERSYIIKIQAKNLSLKILGGYSDATSYNKASTEMYMNQFCDTGYFDADYYKKYKDLFWLSCSIDGKDPEETDQSKQKFLATEGDYQENSSNKKIVYLTVEQSKNTSIKNEKVNNKKDNFIIYDYSREWWEWSYKNRLQEDRKNEVSAFPLSSEFKKISEGWDISLEKESSLNKVCKDFYEKEAETSQDELEDAYRYCTASGSEEK